MSEWLVPLSFAACLGLGWLLAKLPAFAFLAGRGGRFETLDGLRGYLALAVFCHHFVITWRWKVDGIWERPPEDFYHNCGKVGVAIFFMITGFLFVAKLLARPVGVDWIRLYQSRFFRIVPLYAFAVLIISVYVFYNTGFGIQTSIGGVAVDYIRWVLFHGGTINGFEDTKHIIAGVDWSLKYEWLFYFGLPFLAWMLARHSLVLNTLAVLGCIAVFLKPFGFGSFTTQYFILFAVGGLCAALSRVVDMPRERIRHPLVSVLAVAALLVAMFDDTAFGTLQVISMSVFFVLIVLGNHLFGLLLLRSSILLGEISYSIYLLHGMVLYSIFTQFALMDASGWSREMYGWLMPALACVVVMVSAMTFHWIEDPCIRLGRRLEIQGWIRSWRQNAAQPAINDGNSQS